MYTTVGYTESQDSATLVNVAALADPHVRVSGDDITVPRGLNQLIAAYALGPNLTRIQLLSPSLRNFVNQEINPFDIAAEPAVPTAFHYYGDNPIELAEDENVNAQAAEDGAGATRATVLLWLADAAIQPVTGRFRTVRVTNASTLTANVWTNGALTFDQTLPRGRYAIVGAHFVAAGLQAFRFVFSGYPWRPGGVGYDANSDIPPASQRNGGWGVWGEFEHNIPPTVDFLSNSADTSQTGMLDLIQVA